MGSYLREKEKICTALGCKVDDILEFIKEWKTRHKGSG